MRKNKESDLTGGKRHIAGSGREGEDQSMGGKCKKEQPESTERLKTDETGAVTNENFQFVQEKIKERPINKKRLLRRTIITAALALIFGLVACISFFSMEPIISNWLYPEKEPETVTFPEEKVETLPEDMLQTDEEQEALNATPTPTPTPITVIEEVDLTVDDYQTLYSEMAAVADTVQKSVVVVTGINSDVDFFNDTYENEGETSGVIIANNGVELLILARADAVKGYATLMVTFYDGTMKEATQKLVDPNSGLCILAIELTRISGDTLSTVTLATLGSSNASAILATPVIAVGAPIGASGSVAYGMITSNTLVINKKDVNFRILTTDIYSSQEASGIIVNLQGQVIGIINNSYNAENMPNQLSAIGITDLKRTIEAISNEKDRPYMGIYGTDVTTEISEAMNIPRGVYVSSFELGTPAMDSGIQSSDIITGLDEATIYSMSDFTAALYRHASGDTVTITLQRRVQEEYHEMEIEVTLSTLK